MSTAVNDYWTVMKHMAKVHDAQGSSEEYSKSLDKQLSSSSRPALFQEVSHGTLVYHEWCTGVPRRFGKDHLLEEDISSWRQCSVP